MHNKRAFSLVELSIVLVIVGLLAGGVLSGRSLVRASELRSVMRDVEQLTSTTHAFRDKYFGLPGDLTNATSFWDAVDAGDGIGTDCGHTISTDKRTCNGDGDGNVEHNALDSQGVTEKLRYYQHLANAGLISGSYAGAYKDAASATPDSDIGIQWMRSSISNAGYETSYWHQPIYTNPPAHFIKIASKSHTPETGLNGPILAPTESWNLDKKMDDGSSNSGKLVAIDAVGVTANSCVTNGATYTPGTVGSYDLTNSTPACRFYFYMGF